MPCFHAQCLHLLGVIVYLSSVLWFTSFLMRIVVLLYDVLLYDVLLYGAVLYDVLLYDVLLQSMWLVNGFGDREVVKLAAHPDGKHYLALTNDGEVFSWGNGDGGRLGHGDNM